MMLTTTYHYACNTLNIGADAFVLSGAPQLLPPPYVTHCISVCSDYLDICNDKARPCLTVRHERALSHLYAICQWE
jgi:hypothetical protein